MKRLRAIERLHRYLGTKKTKKIAITLRSISRALAPERDAQVYAKWMEAHGLANQKKFVRPLPLHSLQQELAAIEKSLPPPSETPGAQQALAASKKKMIRAWKQARRKKRDKDFHNWRKRIKDLFYQQEALHCPEKKLAKTAELLGKAQDCLVVEQQTTDKELQRILKKEKNKLQRKALLIEKHLD